MTALRHLADTRRATPGPCAICGAEARYWHRTGLAAGGLVRAARACEEHDDAVKRALDQLTTEDAALLTPARRRRAAAAAARRRVDRMRGVASAHARADASLRGASSACHTLALLSGVAAREAEALSAYADALEEIDRAPVD